MRKDTEKHPNNSCGFSFQMDKRHATVFIEMIQAAGLTISEGLKAITYPQIEEYEKSMKDIKANQALKIFNKTEEAE